MKFDSGKIVIWGTGLWLYLLLVLGLSEIVEVSFLLAAATYIPVVALYLFMLSRENKKLSPAELATRKPQGALGLRQRQYTKRDLVDSFIAIFGAVVLGVLTVVFIVRPDMGLELTDSIKVSRINCKRDESKITTLPVEKTVELDGTKISVHSVTYNVPGQSEHPVEFPDKYYCAKATLVEVSIDRPKAISYKGSRDISLKRAEGTDRIQPRYYGIDDWSDYINKKQLTILNDDEFTYKDEVYQKRGWLLFRLPDTYSDINNSLVYATNRYDTSGARKEVSIALPVPK